MPFPLFAHQAPVLPLKAWRPRWFSGTALAIGSLAPDLEYLADAAPRAHGYAHTVAGQFVVCLPATLALAWLVANVAAPALAPRLPAGPPWHLEGIGAWGASLRGRDAGAWSWARAGASALIGSFSHIALDGLTHAQGWAARLWPALDRAVPVAGRAMTVTRCLQYGLTVAGSLFAAAMLAVWLRRGAFARWAGAPDAAPRRGSGLAWFALAATLGAAYGALGTRRALANPDYYFAHGRLHVWGYVLFRAASFAALALVAACALVRARARLSRRR